MAKKIVGHLYKVKDLAPFSVKKIFTSLYIYITK